MTKMFVILSGLIYKVIRLNCSWKLVDCLLVRQLKCILPVQVLWYHFQNSCWEWNHPVARWNTYQRCSSWWPMALEMSMIFNLDQLFCQNKANVPAAGTVSSTTTTHPRSAFSIPVGLRCFCFSCFIFLFLTRENDSSDVISILTLDLSECRVSKSSMPRLRKNARISSRISCSLEYTRWN